MEKLLNETLKLVSLCWLPIHMSSAVWLFDV